MEWNTGFSLHCQTRQKEEDAQEKEDEDKCQRNALVRVVIAGGRDLSVRGEINLVRSGLWEVVIIEGGEMMITLMWECCC